MRQPLYSRNIAVVGANSRLSHHLVPELKKLDWGLKLLSLSEISGLRTSERHQLWRSISEQFDTVVFSAAAIDPALPKHQLDLINYKIPIAAIQSLSEGSSPPVIITLGSALEGIASDNFYIDTKNRLSLECASLQFGNWTHLRTHTLLGSAPPPQHMLMGQLLSALKHKSDFTVHGTYQVREYLHYEQFAAFIVDLLLGEVETLAGVHQVGGKEKTILYPLVEQIMKKYNPKSTLFVNENLSWRTDQTLLNARSNDFELNNPTGLDLALSLVPGWLAQSTEDSE